jgi:hypothetical protein
MVLFLLCTRRLGRLRLLGRGVRRAVQLGESAACSNRFPTYRQICLGSVGFTLVGMRPGQLETAGSPDCLPSTFRPVLR